MWDSRPVFAYILHMDDFDRRALLGVAGLASVAALANRGHAGPLQPPAGPVTPGGKTTQEIYDKVAAIGTSGRTEVNQVNTPGDGTNVYIINAPGSYYLAADVSVPALRNGIRINANGVTLDLNGHVVLGTSDDALSLVFVVPTARQAVVRNGILRNCSVSGLKAGNVFGVVAENLLVDSCRTEGIVLGTEGGPSAPPGGTRATACTVVNCGTGTSSGATCAGIRAGFGCTVERCIVRGGGNSVGSEHAAIVLGAGALCIDSTVQGFVGMGISSGNSCIIRNCSVLQCDWGYRVGAHSVVEGCVAAGNLSGGFNVIQCRITGCVAASNSNYGIHAGVATTITDCIANYNSGVGIYAYSSRARVERNECMQNAGIGINVNGTGNFVANNICSGNGTNWNIAAGNFGGSVLSPAPGGAVSGNAGALTPTGDAFANWTL